MDLDTLLQIVVWPTLDWRAKKAAVGGSQLGISLRQIRCVLAQLVNAAEPQTVFKTEMSLSR